MQPIIAESFSPLQSGAALQQQSSSNSNNRLIVNYLPPTVTEAQLRDMFAPFGTIVGCHLMTDKHTRASLCYGFVEYESEGDVKTAIEAMNGRQMENKRLKVSVARPKSSEIVNANLYISGLNRETTKEQIEAVFGPHGSLIDCHLLLNEAGESKGVAFVRFSTHTEAEDAINTINGTAPFGDGKTINVKFAETPQQKQQRLSGFPGAVPQGRFGFVRQPQMYPAAPQMAAAPGLVNPLQQLMAAQLIQQQQAAAQAAATGTSAAAAAQPQLAAIQQAALLQLSGGNPVLANPALIQQSLLALAAASQSADITSAPPHPTQQNHALSSRRLDTAAAAAAANPAASFGGMSPLAAAMKPAVPAASVLPSAAIPGGAPTTLFVYNLPPEADESYVLRLFSTYGQVTNAKVIRDPATQAPKGYGFVNFLRHEDALLAIQSTNGRALSTHPGRTLQVSFKTEKQRF
ncbi:putative CRE-EXC-7 protein [Paratrimastix pyriformis]|uniref:CRE-EXC-7 protein n=1 Tax=Paratrimastix pyriformis TaxID=342808 RepID=A0ABQ8UJL3_9EUKA|nr:putative CRE-EXC-7 protein [Paratrimastix pyriformis]